MYAHGYDEHGEVLLKQLVDDEHVARLLLEIAGRRLNLIADSSRDAYMNIASVGQQLLHYLDRLVNKILSYISPMWQVIYFSKYSLSN